MAWVQRATGGFLVVYVSFHVWGLRFAPDLLAGKLDLFAVTRRELEPPAMLVFYVLGVLAASVHFGVGWAGVAGYWDLAPSPPARAWGRVALAASVVLAALGLNALFAFVSRPARWLEP
jgi:succinate dehydrogenase / fumarate reductase cytochrome b subunit